MVSSVSSHRLYHKRTLRLCVQSSGNPCKGLFACSLITNHNMSTAAEINKKWGEGVPKTKLEFPVLPPPPPLPPPPKHKQSKAVSVFFFKDAENILEGLDGVNRQLTNGRNFN